MTTMHSGVVTIDRDGRFDGMVSGTMVVGPGVRADVAGMIDGALVVEAGAEVVVSGMVNGGVVNRGGSVTITGMVTG